MESYDIYKDIAERTSGDIYIGDTVIIGLSQQSQQISGFDPYRAVSCNLYMLNISIYFSFIN